MNIKNEKVMCLYTNQTKPLVAEKDITCYKVVYKHSEFSTLHSEIRGFEYELGHTYRIRTGRFGPSENGRVHEGFHSFDTLKHALAYGGKSLVLMKCVIPKGSLYFEGKSMLNMYLNKEEGRIGKQYCSNQLRVIAWKPMWHGKWNTEPEPERYVQ
jgi:hypothetical protein